MKTVSVGISGHGMSKRLVQDNLKFILVPPFMAQPLKNGLIKPSDLGDIEKLSGILSKSHVKKFLYLNLTQFNPKQTKYRDGNEDLVDLLNTLTRFYQPETLPESCDKRQLYSVEGTLNSMIDSINDEHELGLLDKVGYAAHQNFKTVKVSNETYAIILCDVQVLDLDDCSAPLHYRHQQEYTKDLAKLTDLISKDCAFEVSVQSNHFKKYVQSVTKTHAEEFRY